MFQSRVQTLNSESQNALQSCVAPSRGRDPVSTSALMVDLA